MATGGFKSNASTDFLEEWKAKREKMRAKMLGDIAAATGTPLANTNNPERSSSSDHIQESNHSAPTTPTSAPTTPTYAPTAPILPLTAPTPPTSAPTPPTSAPTPPTSAPTSPTASQGPSNLKKPPMQTDKVQRSVSPVVACEDSPAPSPGRGKKSQGPSARKGKGQIEKRKLREKRRSTGVVSLPSNESLDELDDDDGGQKDRRQEEELVQANTCMNEAMTADPATGHIMETPRPGPGRHKSSAGPGVEDEDGGSSRRRLTKDAVASLEKRLEEMDKELVREQQENARLLKAHQEKDDLIRELKEENDLLYRDLDDLEEENDQLKQENKTLLKVVGQLTR